MTSTESGPVALADYLQPILELKRNFAGPNGAEWLIAFKRFLATEEARFTPQVDVGPFFFRHETLTMCDFNVTRHLTRRHGNGDFAPITLTQRFKEAFLPPSPRVDVHEYDINAGAEVYEFDSRIKVGELSPEILNTDMPLAYLCWLIDREPQSETPLLNKTHQNVMVMHRAGKAHVIDCSWSHLHRKWILDLVCVPEEIYEHAWLLLPRRP